MIYDLPTSIEVCGVEYEIESDYRAILDIIIALSDQELDQREKACVALDIFYPRFSAHDGGKPMPPEHYEEALNKCFRFIDRDEEPQTHKKSPRLMDWEKDFQYIVSPINRVVGREIRSMEYMHWWTFLAAYMEIGGDCTFAQIVAIRDKLARHKTLDKAERDWYRRNRDLVDFSTKYTDAEKSILKEWGGM